ncbi:MAG: protein kinase, partial [Chloroflexota bacterium]
LVDQDGNYYLMDFGFARDLNRVANPDSKGGGTLIYSSPEQFTGEPISPQTDLYTFGLMVYEILSGSLPYEAMTPHAIQQLSQYKILPEAHNIPQHVIEILRKATHRDPHRRFGNALEFATVIQEAFAPTLADQNQPIEDEVLAVELFNPYKGLKAFQEYDSDDFFGRDSLVARLLSRLRIKGESGKFLAVIGPSGSGKSSVVKAGLIPKIRNGAVPGSSSWFFLDMYPGNQPFEELEVALNRISLKSLSGLQEQLKADPDGLNQALDMILPPDGSELLLVIDQFEELFTQVADEADRASFIEMILATLENPQGRLRLIVTMRADFYDKPLRYHNFGTLLREHTEVVLPLSDSELAQAIEQPAKQSGADLQPGLLEAIVRDVRESPGILPLLQFTLTQLFIRRHGTQLTLDAYHAMGGVTGSLAQQAETIFRKMSVTEQLSTRQLFLRLVTLGDGTEDTRRRIHRTELSAIPAIETVLDRFGDSRLLTFDRDAESRTPTVEIAHEALIHNWDRFADWINSVRGELVVERSLNVAVTDWLKNDRASGFLARDERLFQFESWAETTTIALAPDEELFLAESKKARTKREKEEYERKVQELALEKQSANRLRYLLMSMGVFLIIGTGLLVYALRQQANAETQAQISQQNFELAATAQFEAEQNADQIADQADSLAKQADSLFDQALVAAHFQADLAMRLMDENNSQDALLVALESVSGYPTIYHPSSYAALDKTINTQVQYAETMYLDHGDFLSGATWNHDESQVLTWSSDGRILLWDAQGDLLATMDRGESFSRVTWNQDSTRLSAVADGLFKIWDAQGELIKTVNLEGELIRTTWNSKGDRILSYSGEIGMLSVWDANGEPIATMSHGDQVSSAIWNQEGDKILSWGNKGNVRVWDEEGNLLTTMHHNSRVWSASWNPAESRILTTAEDNYLHLWDAEGTLLVSMPHQSLVSSVSWSQDGSKIFANTSNDTLFVWDTEGNLVGQMLHEGQSLSHKDCGQDKDQILTWGDDGARLWEEEGNLIAQLSPGTKLSGAICNLEGDQILTWGIQSDLELWNLQGNLIATMPHDGQVSRAMWNHNESQILSWASNDFKLYLWDVEGTLIATMLHEGEIEFADWSQDESQIRSWARDGGVRSWSTQEPLLTPIQFNGLIGGTQWNRDQSKVLTINFDRALDLWGVDGNLIASLEHGGQVFGANWNHDGSQILSWDEAGELRLWDDRGNLITSWDNGSGVRAAEWNQDSSRILSWGDGKEINLLDNRGNLIAILNHESRVGSASWNHDGSQILSWDDEGALMQWDDQGNLTLAVDNELRVSGAIWDQTGSRIFAWGNQPNGTGNIWVINSQGDLITSSEYENFTIDGAELKSDGSQILLSGSNQSNRSGEIRIIDTQGNLISSLRHESELVDATWNRDGSQILSRGLGGEAKLWSSDGELIAIMPHDLFLVKAWWSLDESRIVTWAFSETDGFSQLRYWVADPEELITLAKSRVIRDLSPEKREEYFFALE